jgi:diguanylate cyclase (GGDEF)-like protein/PAS domain S-box-containing protein
MTLPGDAAEGGEEKTGVRMGIARAWVHAARRRAGRIIGRAGFGSFHVQTLLIVALSVATVATILIIFQAESIRRQVLEERADGIARVATSLQESATHAARSGGRAFQTADLQRRLPDLASQLGAVEVAVTDARGVIVAASDAERIGQAILATTVNEVRGPSGTVSRTMPDNTFVFAQPFTLAGDEVGILQTRLDLVSLESGITQATAASIVPSVFVLLAALPLTALVSNRILARTYARDQRLMLEARFGSLVRHSSDLVMILGADGRIQYVSPSVQRVLGRSAADVVGSALGELLHPDDVEPAGAIMASLARTRDVPTRAEWRLQRADGAWRFFETVCTNLIDEPLIGGIVLNGRDVSERRTLQDQLSHQAFHDPLTDLANRALLEDRVDQALARRHRHGREVAVVLLDLDDFKNVNDSLGHQAGDTLLVSVAERLLSAVRETDTAARLGGDEFVLLLDEVDPTMVGTLVARLESSLRDDFTVSGQAIHVSASIGIASTESGLTTTAELLRGADVAMYSAKSSGKGTSAIFQPSLHEAVVQRLRLEADLRRAIERQEFVIEYQPIMRLRTREIVGVEALVRWEDPQRGRVAPKEFIPLAEETGLIVPIGEWILDETARQALVWSEEFADHAPLPVSVNLSVRQVQHPQFMELLTDVLERSKLPPELLVLEITEGVVLRDTQATLDQLRAIRKLGVRLAIDDFGTGYASLAYLGQFPVDILKIDRSFIDQIDRRRDSRALARAIIELGRSLKLTTVAEGVETAGQADLLLRFGCEHAQGFLFARPMPAAGLTALLRRSDDSPVAAGRSGTGRTRRSFRIAASA